MGEKPGIKDSGVIRAGAGPTQIFSLFQTFLNVVRLTHVIYMSQFHRTKHIFVFVGQGGRSNSKPDVALGAKWHNRVFSLGVFHCGTFQMFKHYDFA